MSSVLEKRLDAIYKMAARAGTCGGNARNIARKTVEAACSNSVSSKEDLSLVQLLPNAFVAVAATGLFVRSSQRYAGILFYRYIAYNNSCV